MLKSLSPLMKSVTDAMAKPKGIKKKIFKKAPKPFFMKNKQS